MAYKPPSWMKAGKKGGSPSSGSGEDKGIFGGYDPVSVVWDVAKNVYNAAGGSSKSVGGAKSGGAKGNGKGQGGVSGVSAAAQAKAAKAQKSADRYAQVQRAANKAKKSVLARKGPQDLAGRTQRDMDLKRYRELQKGADSWKARARGEGIRFGGDKPAGVRPKGGDKPSGGSASAGSAVARATGAQASSTTNPTRPQAPKAGAVLAKARKMENSGRGVPITAKELSSFMDYYNKTHKGTLSRSDAVMMARLLKKNSPKVAKKYGLNIATEN